MSSRTPTEPLGEKRSFHSPRITLPSWLVGVKSVSARDAVEKEEEGGGGGGAGAKPRHRRALSSKSVRADSISDPEAVEKEEETAVGGVVGGAVGGANNWWLLQGLLEWFKLEKNLKHVTNNVGEKISGSFVGEITRSAQRSVTFVGEKVNILGEGLGILNTEKKDKVKMNIDEELLNEIEKLLHPWILAGATELGEATEDPFAKLEVTKWKCVGADVKDAIRQCKSMMVASYISPKDKSSTLNLFYANTCPPMDSRTLKNMINAFELLASAATTNVGEPGRYAISLSVLRCLTIVEIIAHNMMANAYQGGGSNNASEKEIMHFEKQKKEEWPESVKKIRRSIEVSAKLKKANSVSISLMLLELVKIDLIRISMSDPLQTQKALNAFGNIASGAFQAITTVQLNDQLLKGNCVKNFNSNY